VKVQHVMEKRLGELEPVQLAKLLTPFFVINIVASLVLLLWPLATPIFCAEFCLLAIWSAWGPGEFWRRFSSCLVIGALFFLSQLYLWIVVFSVSTDIRIILVLVQWLFSAWILAQIPLWLLRYIWQWRITDQPSHDLKRFSVNDNLVGMTMICVALASCRWSVDYLVDEFGPFEFDKSLGFYAWLLFEFYLLIAIAGFGTYLGFRLSRLANQIIPLFVTAGFFAVVSAWIWFAVPERWFAIGVLWLGTIVFSWSIILPVSYMRKLGYHLYHGEVSFHRESSAGGDQ
jgi:hypothetical protein